MADDFAFPGVTNGFPILENDLDGLFHINPSQGIPLGRNYFHLQGSDAKDP
jgi:hypothetical protein